MKNVCCDRVGRKSSCGDIEVPFNAYTLAEASDFKFGTQLGFATAHHKITPSGRGLGLGEHPNIWGSTLIFLQRPRCPLSVSGASYFIYLFIYLLKTSR